MQGISLLQIFETFIAYHLDKIKNGGYSQKNQ
jgi:hypothetical protein